MSEDFANARFAEHPDGAKAVRWELNHRVPWYTVTGDRFSDEQMAEATGWRPVVEADDLTRRTIIGKNDLIDTLSQRIRELEGEREPAPLTLDTLREAWENAEQSEDCREGDTLIEIFDHGAFHTYPATADYSSLPPVVRILHRAPEPWQALADVLAVEMPGIEDEPRIEALAKALHCEHGVRVTGGDDDE